MRWKSCSIATFPTFPPESGGQVSGLVGQVYFNPFGFGSAGRCRQPRKRRAGRHDSDHNPRLRHTPPQQPPGNGIGPLYRQLKLRHTHIRPFRWPRTPVRLDADPPAVPPPSLCNRVDEIEGACVEVGRSGGKPHLSAPIAQQHISCRKRRLQRRNEQQASRNHTSLGGADRGGDRGWRGADAHGRHPASGIRSGSVGLPARWCATADLGRDPGCAGAVGRQFSVDPVPLGTVPHRRTGGNNCQPRKGPAISSPPGIHRSRRASPGADAVGSDSRLDRLSRAALGTGRHPQDSERSQRHGADREWKRQVLPVVASAGNDERT